MNKFILIGSFVAITLLISGIYLMKSGEEDFTLTLGCPCDDSVSYVSCRIGASKMGDGWNDLPEKMKKVNS